MSSLCRLCNLCSLVLPLHFTSLHDVVFFRPASLRGRRGVSDPLVTLNPIPETLELISHRIITDFDLQKLNFAHWIKVVVVGRLRGSILSHILRPGSA
jgi:hypothetical protein